MPVDLYLFQLSPPSLAVRMACKAADVDVNIKWINTFKKEQMTEEYLKINPDHTCPTIVDDGFCLWESKAIMPYLLEKYGKNESLYPKDIKQRAIIDRALMFNAITFTPKVYGVLLPRLAKNEVSEEAEKEFKEKAMDKLNRDLEGKQFIAGDNLTIADFAFWGLITLLGLFEIDTSPWSNICSWAERMKALPYYEECHKELFEFWEEMKKVES